MTMYEKAKIVRRRKQAEINSKVKGAMVGLPSRTARLTFDLTKREDEKQIDLSKNARVKAISVVAKLLDSFDLPSRPRLDYLGITKEATTKDGVIEDGIMKVGAVLQTLMGHKIAIDIPVIIKKKSILEPAVFFCDGSPFVLCKPALDQLIKRGTLNKEVLERRNLFSPPMLDKWLGIETDQPRAPIINRDHMFNPGSRNPWKFRRYSQTAEPQNDTVVPVVTGWDDELGTPIWEEPLKVLRIAMMPDEAHWLYTFTNGIQALYPEGGAEQPMEVFLAGKSFDPLVNVRTEATKSAALARFTNAVISADESGVKPTPASQDEIALVVNAGYDVGQNHSASIGRDHGRTSTKEKVQRERTNIDTPTEFPEIWKGDVKQQLLDPAERNREDLFCVGQDVSLKEDFEFRERGGGQIIIPSGERGEILRDLKGDGLCLQVRFPDMDLTATVPMRFLKGASNRPFDRQAQIKPKVLTCGECGGEGKHLSGCANAKANLKPSTGFKVLQSREASATVDQVKNEVRDMLREGYQTVDIKAAVQKKYPELAGEVLEGLDKNAQVEAGGPAAIVECKRCGGGLKKGGNTPCPRCGYKPELKQVQAQTEGARLSPFAEQRCPCGGSYIEGKCNSCSSPAPAMSAQPPPLPSQRNKGRRPMDVQPSGIGAPGPSLELETDIPALMKTVPYPGTPGKGHRLSGLTMDQIMKADPAEAYKLVSQKHPNLIPQFLKMMKAGPRVSAKVASVFNKFYAFIKNAQRL